MHPLARKLFPYVALAACGAAVAWAVSFSRLPPADFTFVNGDEIKTIDPAKATGAPEGRIINALFEGLLAHMPIDVPPGPDGIVPTKPVPAAAESYTVSPDGKTYTFKIRPTARWSDDTPVTAHDFVWSWRRMLHPETASEYAYQLYYVTGAEKYNNGEVEIGDTVEVELDDRKDRYQVFPRGTVLRGVLAEIVKPQGKDADKKSKWIYVVDVRKETADKESGASSVVRREFCQELTAKGKTGDKGKSVDKGKSGDQRRVEKCLHVLADFDAHVGIRATDDHTLIVTLKNRTPYFDELAAFYPLYPVNRKCVETYGSPNWSKAENIVSNGPFSLEFRRIRDRLRLVKNPKYWNADNVQLNVIDALAVKSETTSFSMYANGQVDWATTVPTPIIPDLQKRSDFFTAPMLTTYFYRLRVTHPALKDARVRRALNMALDKQVICERILKAGQQPARSFVPPGLTGYVSPQCGKFNVAEARRLLDEAGYPGGRNLPKLEILFNTNEAHQSIAEVIQQQWNNNLGIDVELRNLEWATFLDTLQQKQYQVARSGWIGDYPDPNTFLDMFVTDGANNQTGWSNETYDKLIKDAAAESDPHKRMEILHEAETILMEELPIIPIYFYVSINMVHPRVKGFSANIQDLHPLHILSVDGDEAADSDQSGK
jgi:oligopeptide transport system substrate-binding protein